MAVRILIGTDGSEDALAAARRGLDLFASDAAVHLVCVAEPPAVVNAGMESGLAGGIATPEAVDLAWVGAVGDATTALEHTASALGAPTVETQVELGDPGPVLCERAEALS